jgi:uncharacterized protein (TIGR02284 family)
MAVVQDVTSTLNELIQTCIDGQNGFDTAAKAIDDPSLKAELAGYSAQRRDFAAELRRLVAGEGEEPTERGSVAAALHRGWINLKNAISTNDRYAILAECERGEDSAVAEYRKAIGVGLPPDCASVVQSQFAAVQRTHDRIKALRDASKRT